MKFSKIKTFFIPPNITFNVREYWERRYEQGGNSGAGSYGEIAEFKAKTLNGFLKRKKIKEVIDFGCGDGAQLELLNVKSYVGVDVSKHVVADLKKKYVHNKNYIFFTTEEFVNRKVCCSL